ncbi:unnamed protein product [Mytilus edulis]|uniref:C-type lectin domain-containing protein n=1 Tax=Mytilus edulis TaxID=6550 RepID=A0A8S3S819_MYTED|nr:unnamed protein product [Mytilus edulis]
MAKFIEILLIAIGTFSNCRVGDIVVLRQTPHKIFVGNVVFETQAVSMWSLCAHLCSRMKICRSINFIQHNKTCQINNAEPERCTALLIDSYGDSFVAASTFPPQNTCPLNWLRLGSNCYYFSTDIKTWHHAKASCESENSMLAEVRTTMQRSCIKTVAKTYQKTGVSRQPDNFGNTTGEDCILMMKDYQYKWNDGHCDTELPYICEKHIGTQYYHIKYFNSDQVSGKQTTSMNLYTRCVCMFLLLAPYILARDIDCHEQCKCSSKHHEAVCSGRDLIYIPLFPENIHVVTMNGTNLTYIDINGFDNLTIIGLKKLQLIDNLISYIHPNLFKNLKFLSTLLISNEDKLNVDVLKRALGYSAKQKTQHLIFEFNKWSFLPIDLFSDFSSNEVTSLRIKGNAFSSIACETFFVMKSLYFLVLSNNLIEVINMTGIPNTVASLHLNNNMLSSVPDMCANGKEKQSLLRHLSILDLSDNSIGRMQEDSLSCLPALTKVLLNGNPIGRIHNNIFINNPMLYVVQLSKIGYPLKHIDDFALNSSSLSSL